MQKAQVYLGDIVYFKHCFFKGLYFNRPLNLVASFLLHPSPFPSLSHGFPLNLYGNPFIISSTFSIFPPSFPSSFSNATLSLEFGEGESATEAVGGGERGSEYKRCRGGGGHGSGCGQEHFRSDSPGDAPEVDMTGRVEGSKVSIYLASLYSSSSSFSSVNFSFFSVLLLDILKC